MPRVPTRGLIVEAREPRPNVRELKVRVRAETHTKLLGHRMVKHTTLGAIVQEALDAWLRDKARETEQRERELG